MVWVIPTETRGFFLAFGLGFLWPAALRPVGFLFRDELARRLKLIVYALVMPFAAFDSEETSQDRAVLLPRRELHARHLRQGRVVVRQWPVGPVVHDEQQVRAVLLGRKPGRVFEVVADVERHPCVGAAHRHSSDIRVTREPAIARAELHRRRAA